MGLVTALFSQLFANFLVRIFFFTIVLVIVSQWFFGKKKPFPKFVQTVKTGYPLLGNIFELSPENCMKTFLEYPRLYGKYVLFHLGPIRCLLVSDIELCKEILLKRPKKFQRLKLMNYAAEQLNISTALFHAEGNVWSRIRKATAPSFSLLNILNKFSLMIEEIHAWMIRLQDTIQMKNSIAESGSSPSSSSSSSSSSLVDMKYEAFSLTVRVTSAVAFGLDSNHTISQYFFSKEFLNDINKIFKFMGESAIFGLPRWLWQYFPKLYQCEQIALESNQRFAQHCRKVIDYKRRLIAKAATTTGSCMIDSMILNEGNNNNNHHNNMMMIDKALSDEEIIANVAIFYLGGTDTTSVTICWATYFLSFHPELIDLIREEAKTHLFQNSSASELKGDQVKAKEIISKIEANHVKELKVTTAVIKEALRLNGPAPVLGFDVVEDEVTLSNGITISHGDTIWVNQDSVHRNPEIFENPEEFNPNRWLTTDTAKLNAMENNFIPFGSGSRTCPGMNLALYAATLSIAFLVYHFDIQLACPKEEVIRTANFVATPTKLPVYLSPVRDAAN